MLTRNNTTKMQQHIYDTKQQVAEAFSKYLAEFIASRPIVHLALSGGSTPKIVFDELTTHYAEAIDWEKVHLYWGDERCVPPSDDDSNYKMTVAHLISKIDIPDENIHRIKGENDPQEEAQRYSKVLQTKLPNGATDIPQFDLVILGMGDDGHTASIFPHEIALWNADANCVVAVHPNSGQKRVSITGKVINASEAVAFLVTGEGKTEKVQEIINKTEGFEKYPASLVAPDSENLHWFLDAAAAKGITSDRV